MDVALQFALLGLGAGALYGLAALGLVIVYRGSGVINFAHGAIGLYGALLFYELHDVRGWSFATAVVPSLLLCAALGVAVQVLVMWPLRNSSGLTRLLATLGVLSVLQGAASLRYKEETIFVDASLPRSPVKILGASVGADRLWLLLIVLVLVAALGLVYKYTRFGLVTAAAAENARAAGHLGYSSNLIACANWAIGSMLAGLAGILLAPITGLNVTTLTLLVIPALAAAVVGGMVSFPLTLAAGIAMGVIQSELARYVSNPGWAASTPFFVIIAVLSIRGAALPTRGMKNMRMPSVGTGRTRLWVLVPVFVLGVLIIENVSLAWVDGITTSLVVAIVVLSVVVVTGYAGQVSLAQWAMAGLGGWIAARLVVSSLELSLLPAMIIAALLMIPVGVVVGLPAVRTRGDQLAIVTLGVAVAIESLIFASPELTGRSAGLLVGFQTVFGIPVDTVLHPQNYAILALVIFTLLGAMVANLRRGRSGRQLLALRSNERAAASLGVSVVGSKLYAFAFSSMIASIGGVLYCFRNPSVLFGDFQAFTSVQMVGYAVIGGLGYLAGPLVGSTLQPGGVGTTLGDLLGRGIQPYITMIGGLLLIIMLIANPDGVVAAEVRRWKRIGRRVADALSRDRTRGLLRRRRCTTVPIPGATESTEAQPVAPRSLDVQDIVVRFGATDVLNGVSLSVRPGQVVGLIGPNGAGKTTMIDVITGYVAPRSGSVKLGDVSLRGRRAHQRARAGIARSYQSLELFDDLSVLENLLIASERCRWWHYLRDPFFPGKSRVTEALAHAIDAFGLREVLDRLPTELPYGQRRLVAIARAVAAEPSVLLLDEPAAGLSQPEREELGELVRYLADRRGIAVMLIEHDVEMVLKLCDEVVALDFGRVIAQGPPDQMRSDEALIASYLGRSEDHADEVDADGATGDDTSDSAEPAGAATSRVMKLEGSRR